MNSAFKGDYLGFTYNGKHSSELGIVRTSNGSRFDENLLPTIQDKTVQVQGMDGAYYFGSQYTQRVFNISFAFDSLSEQQLEILRRHFGDKKIHDLIFDERPYKVYSAKVTGTATLKYIPFAEGVDNRIYKGEGSITFTCYNPFARSRFKFLDQYSSSIYPNKNEWKAASGMAATQGNYDEINADSEIQEEKEKAGKIFLFNPGDEETDFVLTIPFDETSSSVPEAMISLNDDLVLTWSEISRKGEDKGIYIDTKTNLIYGYKGEDDQRVKTNNLYNEYIKSGDFFKIPTGESVLSTSESLKSWWNSSIKIKYDYLYL